MSRSRHTLFKKCMRSICESRLPRLPGREPSVGFPLRVNVRVVGRGKHGVRAHAAVDTVTQRADLQKKKH